MRPQGCQRSTGCPRYYVVALPDGTWDWRYLSDGESIPDDTPLALSSFSLIRDEVRRHNLELREIRHRENARPGGAMTAGQSKTSGAVRACSSGRGAGGNLSVSEGGA